MVKPINLNKVRKAKVRMQAKATADVNAAKHGQSLITRKLHDRVTQISEVRLSMHKKEDDDNAAD